MPKKKRGAKSLFADVERPFRKATAASLSRALWELVRSDDFTTDDKRSVSAVVALASTVADHASAAEFIFNKGE